MLKRLLVFMLTLILLCSGLAIAESAAEIDMFELTMDDPEEAPAIGLVLEDEPQEELTGEDGVIGCTWNVEGGVLTVSGSSLSTMYSIPWASYKDEVTAVRVINSPVVPANAFSGFAYLTSVELDESVAGIATSAFKDCTRLKTITLPSSMDYILSNAFSGCTSLASVVMPKELTTLSSHAFMGCTSLKSIVIPEGVKNIDKYAFVNCSSLASVSLPSTLQWIKEGAFGGCGLTSVKLPDSMLLVDTKAFYGCGSLASVDFGSGVVNINGSAFEYCTSLKTIKIPASMTYIGYDAFANCTALTKADLKAADMASIQSSLFEGCTALQEVILPSELTDIKSYAFKSCKSLKSISIPGSVRTISNGAFEGCTGLTWIVMEGEAKTMYSTTFSGVTAKVYVNKDDPTWTEDVMKDYGGTLTWCNIGPAARPTGLVAVLGDKNVTIAWDEADNAFGYQIARATTKSGTYTVIKTVTGTSTTTAMPTDGMYYYKIRAYSEYLGVKQYSAYTAPVAIKKLTAPTGLTAVKAGTTINIAWNNVTGATGYTLMRCAAKSGTYSTIKSVTGTSTTNAAPTSGTWYYKIKPYILVGEKKIFGQTSAAAGITILKAPTEIAAVKAGSTINIGWTATEGAAGYSIARSTSKSGTYSPIKSVTGTSTNNAAPTSGTYYYKIRPYVLVGTQKVFGPYSNAVAITTLAKPVIHTITSATAKNATLKWDAVSGATGYSIARSTSSGGTYTALKSVTTLSTTCGNMTSGSTYYFKIRPYVLVGTTKVFGEWSAVRSIKIK